MPPTHLLNSLITSSRSTEGKRKTHKAAHKRPPLTETLLSNSKQSMKNSNSETVYEHGGQQGRFEELSPKLNWMSIVITVIIFFFKKKIHLPKLVRFLSKYSSLALSGNNIKYSMITELWPIRLCRSEVKYGCIDISPLCTWNNNIHPNISSNILMNLHERKLYRYSVDPYDF